MKPDTYAAMTDRDLIARTRRDSAAFGVLMVRYEAQLLRYIHRILCVSREDAEDILQESFIKAYQNLNAFDDALAFSSWMYRIVHNVAISAWRKQRVRPQGNSIDVDEVFLARIASDEDLEGDLNRTLDRTRIREVFAQMDEKYRAVLVLFFLEEKSYREISDILKKPMGSVATLLSRAKRQFRRQCEKAGVTF